MNAKSQKWAKGSILEFDAHGYACTAQMLENPEYAFFDPGIPGKVIFRLWVHNSAYTRGRWQKVGKKPISRELEKQVPRFKKDPISGKLSIYINDLETPATLNELSGLECAAVWDPEHVEDRLRDYIEGNENDWVKLLAPKTDA